LQFVPGSAIFIVDWLEYILFYKVHFTCILTKTTKTWEEKFAGLKKIQYACMESFPFRQKFRKTLIVNMWRSNFPQLKEFLKCSVKDRYQLNYFICIKEFIAQTITSLKLNLFLSLFSAVSIVKGKRSVLIDFCYQTESEVPNNSIYSVVFLVSPYYNYL
jgi:hypothetical protein